MRHQPARTLRNPAAQEQDDEADRAADEEGDAPAPRGRNQIRIECCERAQRAERRPDPERAVDHEVGEAAAPGRDQLLDSGVDGGILAADPRARDRPEHGERPEAPGEARRDRREHVGEQRDGEQLLSAKPVGEPAEEEGARDSPRKIRAGRITHLPVGEMQRGRLGDSAGEAADERDFQPVQDPGDPERHDHERVEPRPGKAVETGGYVGLEDVGIGGDAGHSGL